MSVAKNIIVSHTVVGESFKVFEPFATQFKKYH